MSRSSIHCRRAVAVAFCACFLLVVMPLQAAPPVELTEPQQSTLTENAVLSVEQAAQVMQQAAALREKADKLAPAELTMLDCIECVASAAVGDAGAALERARKLLEQYPDNGEVRRAVYIAACAAGDARLAYEIAKKPPADADSELQGLYSQRRSWLRGVGKAAPEIVLRTDDGATYSVHRRANRVLVLDFWQADAMAEGDVTALRSLYLEQRDDMHFEMAGVNSDADQTRAREVARKHGFKWDQCYEGNSGEARREFRADATPWLVLIDAFGNVRAVGAATEPGFRYAVRAAVAESNGAYAALTPCTRTGKKPEIVQAVFEPSPTKKKAGADVAEQPSNPEALGKLRQARAFIKTGLRAKARALFEEIVRDYPGTPEARDAQEYLDSMGAP